MLTQKSLKKVLRYNQKTGVFIWLVRASKKTHIGDVAGCDKDGYVSIGIGGVLYYAHRLAWLYMTGEWPEDQIDHENTVRSDNRWKNLRKAGPSFNQQNLRKARSNSRTGFLGVRPHRKKFQAIIHLNGKAHCLGTHATPALAHAAYLKEKRKLHIGCTI